MSNNMRYNDEYDGLFKNSDKMKAFDKLAELFYNRNFGTATKADVELLMFSIYMEALIDKNSDDEEVLNYNKCSDYEMAKTLGITQARVRTLKEKKQQRYPVEFDWRKSLANLYDKVTYDPKTGYVSLYIPDRNLFLEIQNYIEEMGGYVDIKLNNKLLCVRPEYFVELAVEAEVEEVNRSKVISNLKDLLNDNTEKELNFDGKGIAKIISKSNNIDMPKVLKMVGSTISNTNTYLTLILNLVKIIGGV